MIHSRSCVTYEKLKAGFFLCGILLFLAGCSGGDERQGDAAILEGRPGPDDALVAHDQLRAALQQSRQSAAQRRSAAPGGFSGDGQGIDLVAHGVRLLPEGTTDVWVHRKFAYIGTFNTPCGDGTGDNGSGIRIYDVKQPKNGVAEVSHIPSVLGSRTNDVKVARLHGRDILVHSNESCAGGPGVWSASFSPSGDQVVTASKDGTARVWNADGTAVR